MLDVELTGRLWLYCYQKWSKRPWGPKTYVVSISKTKWILLNANSMYHLLWLLISPNHRKGPKWPSSVAAHRVGAIGAYRLFNVFDYHGATRFRIGWHYCCIYTFEATYNRWTLAHKLQSLEWM